MQRESYWDYMGRRMHEERNYMYGKVSLTSVEEELFKRVEELERMVKLIHHGKGISIGYDPFISADPKQLELDV